MADLHDRIVAASQTAKLPNLAKSAGRTMAGVGLAWGKCRKICTEKEIPIQAQHRPSVQQLNAVCTIWTILQKWLLLLLLLLLPPPPPPSPPQSLPPSYLGLVLPAARFEQCNRDIPSLLQYTRLRSRLHRLC